MVKKLAKKVRNQRINDLLHPPNTALVDYSKFSKEELVQQLTQELRKDSKRRTDRENYLIEELIKDLIGQKSLN